MQEKRKNKNRYITKEKREKRRIKEEIESLKNYYEIYVWAITGNAYIIMNSMRKLTQRIILLVQQMILRHMINQNQLR